jgi:Cysteine-rich CPCC
VPFENITRPRDGGPYPCPCCRFVTLPERGGDDICPVCSGRDDRQDDHDADEVRGGPNYSLSLSEARRNFSCIGAVEERVLPHVRPPTDSERPS